MLTSILHGKTNHRGGSGLRKLWWLAPLLVALYGGYKLAGGLTPAHEVAGLRQIMSPIPLPDFHLRDHTGQVFDLSRLKGHWSMVFFGYTSCPDICPATLQQLAVLDSTMTQQTIAGVAPQTVFISVDPKRDTANLAGYVGYFAKDFVGVSGDMTEVGKLEKGVGAWHQYQPTAAGAYNVAHSGELFLINPQGELQARLQPPLDIPLVARQLRTLMQAHG